MSNKDETDNLIKSFKAIDKNGDGQLSKKELLEGCYLIQAFINNSEIIDPEAEVERIFKECDKNESGFIDYTGKVF